MKTLIATALILATLSITTQNTLANTATTQPQQNTNASNSKTQQKTWLGVSLAPIPKALSLQLSNVIPSNQGVMVQSVMAGSPAEKANLQSFDVLLSFDKQQLYSAQQLSKLIAASKAGDEVTLGIVRNGSKQDRTLKLGSHSVVTPQNLAPVFYGNQQRQMVPPNLWTHPFARPNFNRPWFTQPPPLMPMTPQGIPQPQAMPKSNVMQQFESINIQKTGDGKVRAEVEFQENNGKKKTFSFEGNYDEVRQQIKAAKDLPEDKKNSLINAIKNNPDQLIPDGLLNFQAFPAMPSFDHFFNQPQPVWPNPIRPNTSF